MIQNPKKIIKNQKLLPLVREVENVRIQHAYIFVESRRGKVARKHGQKFTNMVVVIRVEENFGCPTTRTENAGKLEQNLFVYE